MPYTSDSWTFGHVPTTFKRLPTVNRWGVLHGFYSDQRDDQELSNSAPDMPSGVGFRILANRNIWRFPNISGEWAHTWANSKNSSILGAAYFRNPDSTGSFPVSPNNPGSGQLGFDASHVSNLYQNNLNEVRVNAIFGMMLIRSY